MSDAKTERGFGIYGRIQSREGSVRVQESSAAFTGAHVWLFHDDAPCREHCGEHFRPHPHLNVAQAKELIAALQAFVNDAEGGRLIEPATVGEPAKDTAPPTEQTKPGVASPDMDRIAEYLITHGPDVRCFAKGAIDRAFVALEVLLSDVRIEERQACEAEVQYEIDASERRQAIATGEEWVRCHAQAQALGWALKHIKARHPSPSKSS